LGRRSFATKLHRGWKGGYFFWGVGADPGQRRRGAGRYGGGVPPAVWKQAPFNFFFIRRFDPQNFLTAKANRTEGSQAKKFLRSSPFSFFDFFAFAVNFFLQSTLI
jgi:hypothetical protein